MKAHPISFSFPQNTHREIPKPLVLAAGLAALAVTPWIESPSGRFFTQGAILSVGAVYLYHGRHHKLGAPSYQPRSGGLFGANRGGMERAVPIPSPR